MVDAPGALGGDLPDVERRGHELVGRQRGAERQAVRLAVSLAAGPAEASLAGDHHALGEVSQDGVGRAAERAPRARAAGSIALLPHDLAPEEELEVVLEDADHVAGQAAVRLATEVGHVHRDAPARLEHALALGEDVAEHRQVLEVRRGHALAVELGLVFLAGEVRRGRDDEGDRAGGDGIHVAGVAEDERLGDRRRRGDGGVGRQLGGLEPRVEGGRVVRLAATHPEVGRRRPDWARELADRSI